MKKVQLAVFDFDGTMIDAQSGTHFSWFLLTHGMLSLWNTWRIIWWGFRYTVHLPHKQLSSRRILMSELKKRPKQEVEAVMQQFHDESLRGKYSQDAISAVKDCHAKGCVCVLVSATFYGIAKAAAKHAGFDKCLATKMMIDEEGHLTDEVDGVVIEGAEKPRAVAEWANVEYGEGAWEIAYAYGDHYSDVDLLKEAAHPFAVNPGTALKAKAKRYGWPIVDWH